MRAIPADRHVAARGPTKTSQTRQTGRPRHRLVGLRRHIFDEMSSLTIYLVLHPKKMSEVAADIIKADDNQTGTAALGSSREPLF